MSLVTSIIIAFGQCIALLLNMVALLLIIRAICGWRRVAILAEFDTAGRPLVDRLLKHVTRIWRRLAPGRPLTQNRSLLVAWLLVVALRWSIALFTTVSVQAR